MKKVGPTRGLGPRYGATVRKRYIKTMADTRKTNKCLQCGLKRVKRTSIGVWKCRKCGFTFTGGAYTPTTKLGIVARRLASRTSLEKTVIPKKTPVT